VFITCFIFPDHLIARIEGGIQSGLPIIEWKIARYMPISLDWLIMKISIPSLCTNPCL
jgi:hypothetical protein